MTEEDQKLFSIDKLGDQCFDIAVIALPNPNIASRTRSLRWPTRAEGRFSS